MTWRKCRCGRGSYEDQGGRYRSCFECYEDRKAEYEECLWCGKWHGRQFFACFNCRRTAGREEVTRNTKMMVKGRDGFRCRNCDSTEDLQVDHILPCAKGGTADPWNLQTLCAKCNHRKADTWTMEHAKRLEYQMEQYYGRLWDYLDCREYDDDGLTERDRLYLEMKERM